MKRLTILSLLFASATFSRAEDNLRQQLWDQVGIELKKPFFGTSVMISNIRSSSPAENIGLQKGDKLEEEASWLEISEVYQNEEDLLNTSGMNKKDGPVAAGKSLDGEVVFVKQKVPKNNTQALSRALVRARQIHETAERTSLVLFLKRNKQILQCLLQSGIRMKGIGVNIKAPTIRDSGNVVVEGTRKNSPAEKAGLMPSDVLISANGAPLKSFNDLKQSVLKQDVGQNVTLAVLRGEEKLLMKVPVDWITVEPEIYLEEVEEVEGK